MAEFQEFVELMRKMEPDIGDDDVRGTLQVLVQRNDTTLNSEIWQAVGAVNDSLDQRQFYYWVHHVFGDFEDDEFDDCMGDLLSEVACMRADAGYGSVVPQGIRFPDIPGWDSKNWGVMETREHTDFVSGPATVVPPEAAGKDVTFRLDARYIKWNV